MTLNQVLIGNIKVFISKIIWSEYINQTYRQKQWIFLQGVNKWGNLVII